MRAILALILMALMLTGCAGVVKLSADPADPSEPPGPGRPGNPVERPVPTFPIRDDRPDDPSATPRVPGVETTPLPAGEELFALCESEEEARQIAEIYGIEFVKFGFGVATFHTEEDPSEVVRRGIENGWPHIELNRQMQLY